METRRGGNLPQGPVEAMESHLDRGRARHGIAQVYTIEAGIPIRTNRITGIRGASAGSELNFGIVLVGMTIFYNLHTIARGFDRRILECAVGHTELQRGLLHVAKYSIKQSGHRQNTNSNE